MKPLSTHITESFNAHKLTNSDILAHTHKGLQPSDIRNFIQIAKNEGFEISIDGDYTIVHNDKEVIARIDNDALEVTTNMSKQSFFDIAARKKSGILELLFTSKISSKTS